MAHSFSDGFQDEPDRRREAFPVRFFGLEVFLAGLGERIIFRAAIVLRFAPFGLNPCLLFEAMQSGIERTLIDLEDVFGNMANALSDGPAVHGLKRNGLEDEQVESALHKVGGFGHQRFPLVTDRDYAATPVNKQGEGKSGKGNRTGADTTIRAQRASSRT